MSFLGIDGLTIPVATSSPRLSFDEIGGFSRAVSGAGVLSRQTTKRSWEIETTPMSEAMVSAIETILLAKGLLFQFRGHANASNGYAPATADDLSYNAGLADVSPYYPVSDVPFGHYHSEQSLQLDQVSANELSQNQSTVDTDTTGILAYGGGGAAISRTTAMSMDGNGSLLVECMAAGEGAQWAVTIAATTDTVASAYVWSDVDVTLETQLHNAVQNPPFRSVFIKAGKWTRIFAPALSGSSSTTAAFTIRLAAGQSVPAWFYVDHIQVERATLSPHRWVLGGTSESDDGELDLTTSGFAGWSDSYSVSMWIRPDAENAGVIFQPKGTSEDQGYIENNWTGGYEDEGVSITAYASSDDSVTSGRVHRGQWAHLVVTHAKSGDGGSELSLYLNGVLVGAASTSAIDHPFVSPADWVHAYVGSDGAGTYFDGAIAQLLLVPCVLPASVISMLHNAGEGCVFGAWPRHRVSGGILHGQTAIDAYAQLGQGAPVDFCDADGVWQAGRTLRFKLLEA